MRDPVWLHGELELLRAALVESRAALGQRMMRAFHILIANGTVHTFADFARVLDPSVPWSPKAYRQHSTYQACMYLRRMTEKKGG